MSAMDDPRGEVGRDAPITDESLRDYLAEALPPEAMARVEKALRQSASLRDRLEEVRGSRAEADLHTLGAIWRRGRLTCPGREQLGSFLLDVLDPELSDYLTFHLEVVECPFCRANLADLEGRADLAATASEGRRRRIYHSSRHLLGEGGA